MGSGKSPRPASLRLPTCKARSPWGHRDSTPSRMGKTKARARACWAGLLTRAGDLFTLGLAPGQPLLCAHTPLGTRTQWGGAVVKSSDPGTILPRFIAYFSRF